jgi:hypothetical protein
MKFLDKSLGYTEYATTKALFLNRQKTKNLSITISVFSVNDKKIQQTADDTEYVTECISFAECI